MTPSKTLAKALTRFIGENAVLSFQEGVKLKGQFFVVAVPSKAPIGQAEIRYRNEGLDLVETTSTLREIMYSVQVYRDAKGEDAPTAADAAEELRVRLQGTRARQHMLSFGLAFSRYGEIRDLTTPVDASQEPRFQFDVYYNIVQSITDVILSIESIDINASYQGAFHHHNHTIEVRKP